MPSIQCRPVPAASELFSRTSAPSRYSNSFSPLAALAVIDGQEDRDAKDNAQHTLSASLAMFPSPIAISIDREPPWDCISRRASSPSSITVRLADSDHDASDQHLSDRRVNGSATPRRQPPRVIPVNKNQNRLCSVADTLPMIFRPLSPSQPHPQSRPTSVFSVATSASKESQSERLYRSSSMNISDSSNSSMRILIDAYGGASSRSTTTPLDPSSVRGGNLSRSTKVLTSPNPSLQTLVDVSSRVPSADHLRVPGLDRRHSAILPSKGKINSKTSSYRAPRSHTSSTSSNAHLTTPPFTRLGLGSPGVVLPLTVEEYKKIKRVDRKPASFSETPRPRTHLEKRRSSSSHDRRSSISSKRGSIYVLPPVASVFSAEPLSDEDGEDVTDRDGIARPGIKKLEDLAHAFESKSPDPQNHADRCGREGLDTEVVIENAQPLLTETKRQRVGPVNGCRRSFAAIFVRRPNPGSAEISRQANGSKVHAHATQKIKTAFSNMIRK